MRDAQAAARDFGVGPLLARVLAARGWRDPDAVRAFLAPNWAQLHSPWGMAGMEAAAARIGAALAASEPIFIHGDYDADGLTSTALLQAALQRLGGRVASYIPDRLGSGYGLHLPAIEAAARRGARLMITVDGGIREHAAIGRAAAWGLETIVTDHHLPTAELPPAVAVLNPHRADCGYPEKALTGVGVAFKLAQALWERAGRALPGQFSPWLAAACKLVAIGTVADAAPLCGENRVLVRLGLEALNGANAPGLAALLRLARRAESLDPWRAEDLAFRVAPRLNAAGRMAHADLAVALLTARAPEAAELARQLEALNEARRSAERNICAEALAMLALAPDTSAEPILLLDSEGWHRGVLGLAAARVMAAAGKPVLIFARENGLAHGSGRAPAGCHLLAALEPCADLFVRYGGHAQAVGCVLPCDRLPELRRRLRRSAEAAWAATPPPAPPMTEAIPADPAEFTPEAVRELDRLEPCGAGNPSPVFAATARLVAPPAVLKDLHLKLRIAGPGGAPLEALAWNAAARASSLAAGDTVPFRCRAEFSSHARFGDRVRLTIQGWGADRGDT
ncbi:MAG: single-stranded-DNA-specific exonuclease RecJ [Terriglobales bacterium]